jgi:outer membrane protein assembly factor BamB
VTGRVTATECPNCGAPIDPVELSKSDDPKCPFCHTAIPTESDAPPVEPFVLAAPINVNVPAAIKTGRRAGLIVTVVILLVVGGIVAAATLGHSGTNSSGGGSGYSTAGAIAVPVGPSAADFYVVAPKVSAVESEVVRRVDPTTDKVVWSSGVLDQSDSGVPIVVAGPSQALAIFGTTVVALDAATGHQLWQASLSNGLATPCDSQCAVVVGQRLVALTMDGTVQAFDVASGAQSWSMRLDSTPRWLEPAGTNVLVDETAASGGPNLSVLVIDAASGAARTLTPTCPPGPDIPLTAGATDEGGFFVSPDGTALTVLVTTSGGCALRYNLADGALLWRTATDEENTQIPFTLTGETTAQSQSTLVWTNSGTLFALDTSSGAIRSVLTTTDNTSFTISGIVGSTLIAQSALEDDSDKPATVGIDLTSGKQLWQIATRVVKSGDTQAVELTGSNPVIVSCNSDADTCLFEAVDPLTGTIKGSSLLPSEPGEVDEVQATVTAASLEVVVGWNHVVGFNPTTAAVEWRWPN